MPNEPTDIEAALAELNSADALNEDLDKRLRPLPVDEGFWPVQIKGIPTVMPAFIKKDGTSGYPYVNWQLRITAASKTNRALFYRTSLGVNRDGVVIDQRFFRAIKKIVDPETWTKIKTTPRYPDKVSLAVQAVTDKVVVAFVTKEKNPNDPEDYLNNVKELYSPDKIDPSQMHA